jgi:hypothetical protein
MVTIHNYREATTVQEQKPQETQSSGTERETPQWQRPVLIPLDLADAESGSNTTHIPDGHGCS